MKTTAQQLASILSQSCASYPGGLQAVFDEINARSGGKRAKQTLYSDFNPNDSSPGKLKVADFIEAMKITGNVEALRFLTRVFGYTLMPIDSIEPDAPTVEAEMLQDYPAVVAFHEAIKQFNAGEISYEGVLAKLELAQCDLRQTAAMAKRNGDKQDI